MQEEVTIYNKWVRKELDVKREIQPNGKEVYETSIITDGACYSIIGYIEETEFYKILEGLTF